MKYEVVIFSWNIFSAQLDVAWTKQFRWRWMADFYAFLVNASPKTGIVTIFCGAEVYDIENL